MKISRLLGALFVAFGIIAAVPPTPASAGCSTSCTNYRTQIEFCSSCCRVCINLKGEVTYEGCDTSCVSY